MKARNDVKTLGLALALLLAPALGGCERYAIFGGNPDLILVDDEDFLRSEKPLAVAELEGLWERARQVLVTEGWAIDTYATSYADRSMVTRWNTFLAPTRYEGIRSRTWVRFEPAGEGLWTVAVAVQRQHNSDIDAPLDPSHCEWEEQDSDQARSGVLLWKIEAGFSR